MFRWNVRTIVISIRPLSNLMRLLKLQKTIRIGHMIVRLFRRKKKITDLVLSTPVTTASSTGSGTSHPATKRVACNGTNELSSPVNKECREKACNDPFDSKSFVHENCYNDNFIHELA